MDSLYFTNKANSHTTQVEIYTRQKLCNFRRYVAKAKLFFVLFCLVFVFVFVCLVFFL